MDDIKLRKEGNKFIISSDKLGVADFGDTLRNAIKNFRKAVILMLSVNLDELKLKQAVRK